MTNRPGSDEGAPGSDVRALATGVVAGDRLALARAITLVESSRSADGRRAADLLDLVWSSRSGQSTRLAVTGTPGAGKSTMIEALGSELVAEGRKVAVLAVDPSSGRSGGSILGDKTRMTRLAAHPAAFVRPSPTSGHLGGVTGSTRAAIVLCEAAGYDTVIVETVGVGQSEVDVSTMTDIVLLLVLAGAGDEIQGVKRGILEVADVVVVNKIDATPDAAMDARGLYRSAMSLIGARHRQWHVPVLTGSALTGTGVDAILDAVSELNALLIDTGQKDAQRLLQRRLWFEQSVRDAMIKQFLSGAAHQAEQKRLAHSVDEGTRCPSSAAISLVTSLAVS